MYQLLQSLSQWFKRGIAILVLGNCALLSVPWLGKDKEENSVANQTDILEEKSAANQTYILASVSAVFTMLFFLEVRVKSTLKQ